MGVVWAATNELTEKSVALKLIPKWGQESEEVRRRLLREAKAYGRLSHRNVVEIYDVGQTDEGEPFLVMQLLTGETLGQLIKREKKLKPQFACLIGLEIGRALSAAHAAGIVHRDLKPPNVYLHREHDSDSDIPIVKVLDFGVSKMLSGQDGSKTETGSAVGSPAYMSPEQAKGERFVDHRTDIWSVGVLLFEMLTGRRPFEGETMFTVVADILKGRIPRVTEFAPEIDPTLAYIVARCIERDLTKRVQTADELVGLLRPHAGVRQTSLDMSAMLASVPITATRLPTYVPPASPPQPPPPPPQTAKQTAPSQPAIETPAPPPATATRPPVPQPNRLRATVRMEDPARGITRAPLPSISDIPTAPGAGNAQSAQVKGAKALPAPPPPPPQPALIADEETHQREPVLSHPVQPAAAAPSSATDSKPAGFAAPAAQAFTAPAPQAAAADDDDALLDAATSVMISHPPIFGVRPALASDPAPSAPTQAAPPSAPIFQPDAAPALNSLPGTPTTSPNLFAASAQPGLSSISGMHAAPLFGSESSLPPSPLSTNSPITSSSPGTIRPAASLDGMPSPDGADLALARARSQTRGRVILFSAVGGAILMVLLLFGLRNGSNQGEAAKPIAFEGIAPRHNAIAAALRRAADKAAANPTPAPSASDGAPAPSATGTGTDRGPLRNNQPNSPIKKPGPGGKKKIPFGVPDSPG